MRLITGENSAGTGSCCGSPQRAGRWSPGPAPPRGHDGSGCHRRGDLAAGWRTGAPAVFGWPG